jgi:hypothetical protein
MASEYDPSLVQEPPGSGGAAASAQPTSPMQAAFDRALKLSQNPLYRFGSALRGQDPNAGLAPLLQMQLQQEQLGLEKGRLDLARQAETRNQQGSDAQIAHIRMQIGKGVIDSVKEFHALGIDLPEPALKVISKNLANLGVFATRGSGEEGFITPDLVEHMLKNRTDFDAYLSDLKDLTPAQRKVGQHVFRTQGVKAGMEWMKEIKGLNEAQALTTARTKLSKLPKRDSMRTFVEAMVEANLTDAERNSVFAVLEQGKGDNELQALGIVPPSVGVGAAKAGAETRAKLAPDIVAAEANKTRQIELAKEGTPQGKANLAKTQADTALATENAAIGKIVPGNPGASIIQVTSKGTKELVAAKDKPAGGEARERFAVASNTVNTLGSLIDTLGKDGPDRYFGLKQQGTAAGQRGAEQVGVGGSDTQYEDFWAKMDELKAEIIRAREKGNVSKSDADLFLGAWPDRGLAPSAALARLKQVHARSKARLKALSDEFPDLADGKSSGSAPVGDTPDARARAKYLKK